MDCMLPILIPFLTNPTSLNKRPNKSIEEPMKVSKPHFTNITKFEEDGRGGSDGMLWGIMYQVLEPLYAPKLCFHHPPSSIV